MSFSLRHIIDAFLRAVFFVLPGPFGGLSCVCSHMRIFFYHMSFPFGVTRKTNPLGSLYALLRFPAQLSREHSLALLVNRPESCTRTHIAVMRCAHYTHAFQADVALRIDEQELRCRSPRKYERWVCSYHSDLRSILVIPPNGLGSFSVRRKSGGHQIFYLVTKVRCPEKEGKRMHTNATSEWVERSCLR